MLRRLRLTVVLLAWLLATGSQWDCAQVVAWSRMIAGYSEAVPLNEAVRLTFTPGNECEICKALGAAKQSEQNPTLAPKSAEKIVLVIQPAPAVVLVMPALIRLLPAESELIKGTLRASPPVPPPRAA